MEIRQLRYFISVVRFGGVGAAAEAHFVTQPAVSAQLKKLEEEVGEPLFERRGRRMILTPAGDHLVRSAESVLNQMDALEASLARFKGLETGTLRMGNIDAASIYVLPEIYRAFHSQYPGIQIEIVVGDTRALIDALNRGEIELATTTLPTDENKLSTRPFYRERLVAVASAGHPLATRKRVTLGDLVEHGLIVYPARSTTRRLIDAVFAKHGVPTHATMEISSPEAIRRLTQAGLGVSILPDAVVKAGIDRGLLVALPVPGARFERHIGMVYRARAGLSPAARTFLEMVEAEFPDNKAT